MDYLKLIEQGVGTWNRWRSEHPDERPDLRAAYLFEKSLQGINLRNTNLHRACLIGANLSGADLTGANLSGVYASNANFQSATLVAANLRDGQLGEANFNQADLSNAVVDNANLKAACLAGTHLDNKTKSNGGKKPTLPRHLLMGLGVGVIALFIAETAIYLTTRPRLVEATTTPDSQQVVLVCKEPEPTAVLVDRPDYEYQDGSRFYGSFVDGKPANGRGTMLYASGNRYDGEYRDGQRNGCGTFTFKNGRRYIGEFKSDLFSGRGTWILENGDRYMGDFEYSKCNGEGVFVFADGSSKSGVWQQGRLAGGDLFCDRGPMDLPES